MTDVVEPGTQLVPADSEGHGLVQVDDEHAMAAEGHAHPGPRQYVLIALVLVILTAVEVAVSYIDTIHTNWIILVLAVLAATKFFLVCAWYMHMKQDAPFFRRVFTVGIV